MYGRPVKRDVSKMNLRVSTQAKEEEGQENSSMAPEVMESEQQTLIGLERLSEMETEDIQTGRTEQQMLTGVELHSEMEAERIQPESLEEVIEKREEELELLRRGLEKQEFMFSEKLNNIFSWEESEFNVEEEREVEKEKRRVFIVEMQKMGFYYQEVTRNLIEKMEDIKGNISQEFEERRAELMISIIENEQNYIKKLMQNIKYVEEKIDNLEALFHERKAELKKGILRVFPSRTYNEHARPRNPTIIPQNANEEERRSLRRENEAAELLAKNGYEVEQNPNVPNTRKNPDYRIEGLIYDCYAPEPNTSIHNIWMHICGKSRRGQARRIVLNLDDWNGDLDDIKSAFQNKTTEKVEEVIVVLRGNITSVYPKKLS